MRRATWSVLAGAALLAGLVPHAAVAADLSEARYLRLDNGLQVLTLHDPSYPVVAVQALYNVGARNETTGVTGIAHFLEHMLFRGTKSFGLADITGVIERAGGEWHGYTFLDQTTYFEAAPRDLLPTLLKLEAERLTASRIAADEVDPERGAVFQELRGYQNDPRSSLFDEALAALFQQHPYRNNTMGWESDLAGIDHADLVGFYRRYYGPHNAVVAIVGDFDPSRIEEQVREAFGSLPASGEDTSIRTVEPPLTGQRRLTIRRPGASPALMVSFLSPQPARARDYAALMVLDGVLSRPRGLGFRGAVGDTTAGATAEPRSRFGRALAASAASRFGTSLMPTRYPYAYTIYADPKPGRSPEDVLPALFETLAGTAASVSREEIDNVRQRIEAGLPLETDSLVDAAHELAFWTGLGGVSIREEVIRALATIGPEDVSRLARLLIPERATVAILLPTEGTAPGTPAAAAEADAGTGKLAPAAAADPQVRPASPDAGPLSAKTAAAVPLREATVAAVDTLDLGHGARAIVDARPGSKTFHLRLAAFPSAGVTDAAGVARLRGAARALRGAAAGSLADAAPGLRLQVQELGEGAFAERDTLQVSLAGPAAGLEAALRSLGPALAGAIGAAHSVEPSPAHDPEARAIQVLAKFASLPVETDAEKGAGKGAANKAGKSGRTALSLDVALVSPYSSESVRSSLESLIPSEAEPASRRAGGHALPPLSGRKVENLPDLAQGRLLVAFAGAEDAEALQALTWILHHSYSGRLGVRAIAEMGLVYSMDSEAVARGRPLALFTMGVEPPSLPTLEIAMQEVLDRTAATLTEKELADFKSATVGSLPVRLSDPEKAARAWLSALLRGEDQSGPARAVERARALSLDRLSRFARTVLDPARRLTVVVTSGGASAATVR